MRKNSLHQISIILIMVMGLFLVGCVRSTHATTPTPTSASLVPSTYYVAPDGDDANSCMESDRPCQTVYAAYAKASNYDTIQVAVGTYRLDDPTWQSLGIRKIITIIGAGRDLTIFRPELNTYSTIQVFDGGALTLSHIKVLGPTEVEHAIWGGLHVESGGDLTVRDCIIRGSSAYGIVNEGGTIRVESSTVRENYINVGVYSGDLELNNTTITAAQSYGITNNGNTTLRDSVVTENGSVGVVNRGNLYVDGGLIQNNGYDPELSVVGGRVELHGTNIGRNGGRGIIVYEGADLLIFNSTVERNSWGIIVESGAHLSVNQSTIRRNVNGIENRGIVELHESLLVNNTRQALWNDGGQVTIDADSEITRNGNSDTTRSLFTVQNTSGSMTIENSRLEDNFNDYVLYNEYGSSLNLNGVTVSGPGILLTNSGTMLIQGSVFKGGTIAVTNGGDLDMYTSAIINSKSGFQTNNGTVTIINSTISGMTDDRGLSVGGGDFRMEFGTVITNRADVNFPYFSSDAHTTVRNSILVRNCRHDAIFGISAESNLGCTDEELGVEPLTEMGGTWVHPLRDGSPAIDAADGCPSPSIDQTGYHRYTGGGCDIGAFEWRAGVVAAPAATAESLTPTPEPAQVIAIQNANCRYGPGTAYDIADTLFEGQSALIRGRNEGNTWWQIQGPTFGTLCWVSKVTVKTSGDTDTVPIGKAPPLPVTPSAPVKGCFVYDQYQNVVCTVPCPPNPQPGGVCTP